METGVLGCNNLHDGIHSFNKVLMKTRCLMSLIPGYSWTSFTLFIRTEVCARIVQHATHSEATLLGSDGYDHRVHKNNLNSLWQTQTEWRFSLLAVFIYECVDCKTSFTLEKNLAYRVVYVLSVLNPELNSAPSVEHRIRHI